MACLLPTHGQHKKKFTTIKSALFGLRASSLRKVSLLVFVYWAEELTQKQNELTKKEGPASVCVLGRRADTKNKTS